MKTKQKAEYLILSLQDRYPMKDLNEIQDIVIWHIKETQIEGDVINEFYWESVINWVKAYNQD